MPNKMQFSPIMRPLTNFSLTRALILTALAAPGCAHLNNKPVDTHDISDISIFGDIEYGPDTFSTMRDLVPDMPIETDEIERDVSRIFKDPNLTRKAVTTALDGAGKCIGANIVPGAGHGMASYICDAGSTFSRCEIDRYKGSPTTSRPDLPGMSDLHSLQSDILRCFKEGDVLPSFSLFDAIFNPRQVVFTGEDGPYSKASSGIHNVKQSHRHSYSVEFIGSDNTVAELIWNKDGNASIVSTNGVWEYIVTPLITEIEQDVEHTIDAILP